MFTRNSHLKRTTLSKDIDMAPTRDGFGVGVVEVGKKNDQVMVLCADLADSTRAAKFKDAFPNRFIQMGIQEQNMATVAVGLALSGKVPFIATYAVFSPGRNWDQIRISGAYNKANVKYVGAHTGVSVGPDGATHQSLEDMALMRVLPGMTVLVPCDAEEARKVVHAAADITGPVYMRFARAGTPSFTTIDTPFAVGKAQVFRDGADVAVIACGPIIHAALVAADQLIEKGISVRVINCPSIKPLDEKVIISAARDCGAIVTCEEHQVAGGLGSAVAELVARNRPVPMEFIGMQDSFGESGEPEQLLAKYRMDTKAIIAAIRVVHKRKSL